MSVEIIQPNSSLVNPQGEVISSGDDNDVKMTVEQWSEILEKLRKADLYMIALATLARNKAGKVKIAIRNLRETEAKHFGLAYNDDGKDMVFMAIEPPAGEAAVN